MTRTEIAVRGFFGIFAVMLTFAWVWFVSEGDALRAGLSAGGAYLCWRVAWARDRVDDIHRGD